MISTSVSPKIGGALAQAVTRGNETRERFLKPYRLACQEIEGRQQWPHGYVIRLMDFYGAGLRWVIALRAEDQRLKLFLIRLGDKQNKQYNSKTFIIGGLTESGWRVWKDEAQYLRWHTKVRRDMPRVRH